MAAGAPAGNDGNSTVHSGYTLTGMCERTVPERKDLGAVLREADAEGGGGK